MSPLLPIQVSLIGHPIENISNTLSLSLITFSSIQSLFFYIVFLHCFYNRGHKGNVHKLLTVLGRGKKAPEIEVLRPPEKAGLMGVQSRWPATTTHSVIIAPSLHQHTPSLSIPPTILYYMHDHPLDTSFQYTTHLLSDNTYITILSCCWPMVWCIRMAFCGIVMGYGGGGGGVGFGRWFH